MHRWRYSVRKGQLSFTLVCLLTNSLPQVWCLQAGAVNSSSFFNAVFGNGLETTLSGNRQTQQTQLTLRVCFTYPYSKQPIKSVWRAQALGSDGQTLRHSLSGPIKCLLV